MNKNQEALNNIHFYCGHANCDKYLNPKVFEELNIIQELVDKHEELEQENFDLRNKLNTEEECCAMLEKKVKKLKDIIALFVKKFDLSLNKKLKELHFDHTNYEWREINDGYSEEHYYQLTDKEYDLVEEVFQEDE